MDGICMRVSNVIKHNNVKLSLKKYFIKILQEDWDVLFLITRKGYWAYKILMDESAWTLLEESGRFSWTAIKNGRKIIYSDRFVSKALYMENFAGKRVYIYDDTMTRGANIFFYYGYMKKEKIEVTPIVYALSTEYPSEQSKKMLEREYQRIVRNDEDCQNAEKEAESCIEDFNQALKYCRRLTPESLAEICVHETEMFKDSLCPLVIDLPILSRMKIKEGEYTQPAYINNGRGVMFSKEQFRLLMEENDEWKFMDNQFPDNYLNNCSSYFKMNTVGEIDALSPVIHDLIVKCKYKDIGDDVKVVFVPFAIFRSMSFKDVGNVFFALWENTGYRQYICEFINKKTGERWKTKEDDDSDITTNGRIIELMKNNHNFCRNMFRSVIFCVSTYIGMEFMEYVKKKTGVELDYDRDFLKESFPTEFIDSFEKDDKDYKNLFLKVPNVKRVSVCEHTWGQNEVKKFAKKEMIEKSIRRKVIDKKNNLGDNLLERVYTFESIEADLEKEYIFQNDQEKQDLLTMTLIDMLENSRLGNEIFVDNEKRVVYRGFRTGENSEILFYKNMEYFYAYIYAYYYFEKDNYEEKYGQFIEKLEYYFISKKYIDQLLSREDFLFYAEYFGNLKGDRLAEQITNKKYVLKRYWDKEDQSGFRSFVDQAFENVRIWMS